MGKIAVFNIILTLLQLSSQQGVRGRSPAYGVSGTSLSTVRLFENLVENLLGSKADTH